MKPEILIILKKRFSSFLWRSGAVFAVGLLDFAAENLGLFNLPTSVVVLIGLVLGEITKLINSNLKQIK